MQQQNSQPQAKNQPQNGQKGGKGKRLSDKQIDRAKAKMRDAGQSVESVQLWIEKKFNKTDMYDLTYQEYNELCKSLDAAAKQPKAN